MKYLVHRNGFTAVEVMVVVALVGILSAMAVINFANLRAATSLTEATGNLVGAVEKARQFSAAGAELRAGIFPSYGVAFDTAQPRDVIIFADCLLDDDGNGQITADDDFTFDPASTECGGGSSMVERVRISTNPRVAIRAVRSVVAATQAQPRASVVYMRPDPTTWVAEANGTILPYGRIEVVVGSTDGARERVVRLWTSGLIDAQ